MINKYFGLPLTPNFQVCNKIVDARVLCLQGRLDEAKQSYCTVTKVLPSFVRENAESSSEDEEDDDEVTFIYLISLTDTNSCLFTTYVITNLFKFNIWCCKNLFFTGCGNGGATTIGVCSQQKRYILSFKNFFILFLIF